jgi:hypothetical protein
VIKTNSFYANEFFALKSTSSIFIQTAAAVQHIHAPEVKYFKSRCDRPKSAQYPVFKPQKPWRATSAQTPATFYPTPAHYNFIYPPDGENKKKRS